MTNTEIQTTTAPMQEKVYKRETLPTPVSNDSSTYFAVGPQPFHLHEGGGQENVSEGIKSCSKLRGDLSHTVVGIQRVPRIVTDAIDLVNITRDSSTLAGFDRFFPFRPLRPSQARNSCVFGNGINKHSATRLAIWGHIGLHVLKSPMLHQIVGTRLPSSLKKCKSRPPAEPPTPATRVPPSRASSAACCPYSNASPSSHPPCRSRLSRPPCTVPSGPCSSSRTVPTSRGD